MKELSEILLEKLRINKDTELVKKDPITVLKQFFENNYYKDDYKLELFKYTDKATVNIELNDKSYSSNIQNRIDKWLNKNDITNYSRTKSLGIGGVYCFSYTFYVKNKN